MISCFVFVSATGRAAHLAGHLLWLGHSKQVCSATSFSAFSSDVDVEHHLQRVRNFSIIFVMRYTY